MRVFRWPLALLLGVVGLAYVVTLLRVLPSWSVLAGLLVWVLVLRGRLLRGRPGKLGSERQVAPDA